MMRRARGDPALPLLRVPRGRAGAAGAEGGLPRALHQRQVHLRRGLQEHRAGDQAQRADLLALLGYASHALSTVDLLGVPVPTLRVTTDAASFELCVCGHDFTAAQHGVQFRQPMDMAVRAFSAGELARPLVGVREKRHAAESEVKRDLTDRAGVAWG